MPQFFFIIVCVCVFYDDDVERCVLSKAYLTLKKNQPKS